MSSTSARRSPRDRPPRSSPIPACKPPTSVPTTRPPPTRKSSRADMAAALELRDLHAAYGRIEVLHGVDLIVPEASVFALLGPNGAGKTTTLKTIDGRLRPSRGCVHVADTHVNGASTDSLARAGVISIPEGRGVF